MWDKEGLQDQLGKHQAFFYLVEHFEISDVAQFIIDNGYVIRLIGTEKDWEAREEPDTFWILADRV
jgi:hypothetical protein